MINSDRLDLELIGLEHQDSVPMAKKKHSDDLLSQGLKAINNLLDLEFSGKEIVSIKLGGNWKLCRSISLYLFPGKNSVNLFVSHTY